MAASEHGVLDLEDLASRYDAQVLREYLLEQEDGAAARDDAIVGNDSEATTQASLTEVHDLRPRCFRRLRVLLVANCLAYWAVVFHCGSSFYSQVEEAGLKTLPSLEIALLCVFVLGTQGTLELAAGLCLTHPVRSADVRSSGFTSWDGIAWLTGAGARSAVMLDVLCLPLMKRGSALLYFLSASTFLFAIGIFVVAVQLRLILGLFCGRDHFSYDKPDLFFKGRDFTGLMDSSPIAARPPANRQEEDAMDLRLGRSPPVNAIKAANFAHVSDLALIHAVLKRLYIPMSCQESQEFVLSVTSFSRCFCEDVVQCSLKFFFLMDCEVNLLVLLSLLVSATQAIGSCLYSSTSALDLRTSEEDQES